jgi:hypothetical protein
VGSSRIRGNWVMKYTPEIVPFENAGKYDAVIFQKAYWKEYLERFDGVKIFDMCDADWLEGRPVQGVIELVDAITVTTKPMQDFLKQITDKPVVIIPDRIDPDAHVPTKEVHLGRLKTVVWFGYSQNQKILEQTINILEKHNIKLAVISDKSYMQADINIKYSYDRICEDIIAHDAVIMPSYEKDARFIYKSNNKTLTSWALKMPVIREIPDLERFLDPEERKKEGEARYKEILEKWHVRDSGKQYLDLIKKLKGGDSNGS